MFSGGFHIDLLPICIRFAETLRANAVAGYLSVEVSSGTRCFIFRIHKRTCGCPAFIEMRDDFLPNPVIRLLPLVVTSLLLFLLLRRAHDHSFDMSLQGQLAIEFMFLSSAQVIERISSFGIWAKSFQEVAYIFLLVNLSKSCINLDEPAKVFSMLIVAFDYYVSVPRVLHIQEFVIPCLANFHVQVLSVQVVDYVHICDLFIGLNIILV